MHNGFKKEDSKEKNSSKETEASKNSSNEENNKKDNDGKRKISRREKIQKEHIELQKARKLSVLRERQRKLDVELGYIRGEIRRLESKPESDD